MAKTSKGMILNSQNKLQSDSQFVLIDIDDKSSAKLIDSINQNLVFVDAVSKQTNWIKSSLDQLGLNPGCYLISDLRDQIDINVTNLINGFSSIRQYGYQVGIIADISQLPNLDDLIKNQVYLINSGESNQKQNALLQNNEIDDYSNKLSKGMSVTWQRDYTNVNVSIDHSGYVGMGKDTFLRGGKGFGYSTNGKDFNTVISPKGIIFRRPDAERMWRLLRPKEIEDINNTVGGKVKQEIDSATAEIPNIESAANEAVKRADSAIAASKVNSDAIVAQNSAVVEVKKAMDSANAAIQQVASNATSDAAQIRADVAQIQKEIDTSQSANSASVEKLKSDISSTQKNLDTVRDNLDKAQSAVEQNQKLITDSITDINSKITQDRKDIAAVQKQLTGTQSSISDIRKDLDSNVAQIRTDVAQVQKDVAQDRKDIATTQGQLTSAQSSIADTRKALDSSVADINSKITQDREDIATAQQANADTAKKLDSYAKQATEQGKTIKIIQDKQDGFSATIADVKGNVSKVSDTVDGLTAGLKDAQGNIASVKAQADQFNATLTDHSKNIAQLTTTAKKLSSTLEDASGRLSKVEQTAIEQSTTLSDLQGNLTKVKQTADGLVATVKDVQGNITQIKQDATGTLEQLSNAQSDITTLQKNVSGIKLTIADHDKNIHTLQADSKTLKDNMADAQGNISSLQKTSTSLTSTMQDHSGRLSKVEQTANGTKQTVADQQGQINTIKTDANGIHQTLTGHGNQIATINTTLDGLNTKYEGVSGDLSKLNGTVATNSTQIAQNKQTIALKADQSAVDNLSGRVSQNTAQLKVQADQINSKVSSTEYQTLKDKVDGMKIGGRNLLHGTSDQWIKFINGGWGCFTTAKSSEVSTTEYHNGNTFTYSATICNNGKHDVALQLRPLDKNKKPLSYYGSASVKPGQQNMRVSCTASVDENTWYMCVWVYFPNNDGSNDTVLVKEEQLEEGNVRTPWTPNPDDTIASIQKNATAIDQTNKQISLKADQTTVDNLSGEVNEKTAQLKLQADSLSATVTDQGKNISSLQATAKEQSTTLSTVQGNLSQVKQTADGLVTTLKDAQGNIIQLQQTAKGTTEQISGIQGDITTLQTDVTGAKATIADHDKNIHTLQADSKTLKDNMADAKGNISSLQKTSTSLTSEMQDHSGRLSKVEQTASTLTNEFSDHDGRLSKVEQTANGTQQTVANQQGQINTIKTDAAGIHQTLTGQGNQIATINTTLDGLNTKYEGVSGDLGKLKNQAQWVTVTGAVDLNSIKTPCHEFLKGKVTNAPNEAAWWYLTVESSEDSSRVNQMVIADQSNNRYTRRWSGEWSAWVKDATQTDVTALSNRITTNSTQIDQNKQAITLKADQATVDNLSGKVNKNAADLKVQADQINSKVSSTEYQTLKDKVDGMKIGGRNLLHGTSDQWIKFINGGWGCFTTAKSSEVSTTEYHNGNTFTYSATICNNGKHDVALQLRPLDKNKKPLSYYGSASVKPGQQNMRVSCTASVDENTWYMCVWVYFPNNDGSNDTVLVKEEQLEEGNVRTPWTPNPDDTIASIQKNTTAIEQNKNQISLKADQTEVDKVKNTASNNSSRLDVMDNKIQSKVTSTDVNNIVDSKGYATTNSVQSMITQSAGSINETITNLEGKFNSSSSVNLAEKTNQGTTNWNVSPGNGKTTISEVNINGIRGVRFTQTRKSTSWWVITYQLNLDYFEPNQDYIISFDMRTSSDASSQSGILNIARGDSSHAYLANTSFKAIFKQNQLTHVSCTGHSYSSLDKDGETFYLNCLGLGQCDWVDVVNLKIARGTIDKGYSPAPSDNATVTQLQSVTASIDGLKSNVTNYQNDTSSKFTQLSGSIQSKVSQSDFNSKVTQLANDINLRVTKDGLLSQINLTAGNTLIQSGKIYLDADSVVFGANSRAFIPSAAIENLDAAKITTGTLNGVDIHQIETAEGRSIDISNGNITFASNDKNAPRLTFRCKGENTKMFNAVGDFEAKSWTMFNFAPSDTQSQNPIPFFTVENRDSDGSGNTNLWFDHALLTGHEWWANADGITFGRSYNGTGGSNDYVNLYAKAFLQHSQLSSKTRIEKLEGEDAMDAINQLQMYTYQYKDDVRDGKTKRYASLIIDDVNDVARYTEPEIFLADNGKSRDDGTQLAYLTAAVQYQQEEIEKLKDQLKEKKG